jgi:hypothetical protein
MTVDKNTYFIAHNEKDIFHYGWAVKGQALDSGQPIKEYFYSRSRFLTRCKELNIEVDIEDVPEFQIDLTPPTPLNLGVVIPEKFLWVFPEDKFILEGFEIPLQNGAVDVAYFQWQAFRDCLDNGNHEFLKRALMPLWDYVAEQVENQNLINL